MPSKAKARIASVRSNLAQVRDRMIDCSAPEIEQAEPCLAEAIQTLTMLEQSLDRTSRPTAPERAELLREMTSLRADLLKLATLSSGGLEFCRNWSNVLKSAAGYLADGSSAAVETSSTILIEG